MSRDPTNWIQYPQLTGPVFVPPEVAPPAPELSWSPTYPDAISPVRSVAIAAMPFLAIVFAPVIPAPELSWEPQYPDFARDGSHPTAALTEFAFDPKPETIGPITWEPQYPDFPARDAPRATELLTEFSFWPEPIPVPAPVPEQWSPSYPDFARSAPHPTGALTEHAFHPRPFPKGVYVETDTAADCGAISSCSGATVNPSTLDKEARVGGRAGSTGVNVSILDTLTRAGIMFQSPANDPGLEIWPAGDWVVRINHSANILSGITWEEAYVCRVNNSCGTVENIGQLTGIGQSVTSLGVYERTIQGKQSKGATDDTFYIVVVFTNASGFTRTLQWTPDQEIDTPLAGTPILPDSWLPTYPDFTRTPPHPTSALTENAFNPEPPVAAPAPDLSWGPSYPDFARQAEHPTSARTAFELHPVPESAPNPLTWQPSYPSFARQAPHPVDALTTFAADTRIESAPVPSTWRPSFPDFARVGEHPTDALTVFAMPEESPESAPNPLTWQPSFPDFARVAPHPVDALTGYAQDTETTPNALTWQPDYPDFTRQAPHPVAALTEFATPEEPPPAPAIPPLSWSPSYPDFAGREAPRPTSALTESAYFPQEILPGIYIETDATADCGAMAACSGATVSPSTVAREAAVGGKRGSGSPAISHPALLARASVMFQSPANQPGLEIWPAGLWTVRLNHSAVSLTDVTWEELYVCRVNNACGTVESVASATGLGIDVNTAPRIYTQAVQGKQSKGSVDDTFYIVVVFRNVNASPRTYVWKPDQNIDTPLAGTPILPDSWLPTYPDFARQAPHPVAALTEFALFPRPELAEQLAWAPEYPSFPGRAAEQPVDRLTEFAINVDPLARPLPPNPLTWQPSYPDFARQAPHAVEALTEVAFDPEPIPTPLRAWSPSYPDFAYGPEHPTEALTGYAQDTRIESAPNESTWQPDFPDFARAEPHPTGALTTFSFDPAPERSAVLEGPTFPDMPGQAAEVPTALLTQSALEPDPQPVRPLTWEPQYPDFPGRAAEPSVALLTSFRLDTAPEAPGQLDSQPDYPDQLLPAPPEVARTAYASPIRHLVEPLLWQPDYPDAIPAPAQPTQTQFALHPVPIRNPSPALAWLPSYPNFVPDHRPLTGRYLDALDIVHGLLQDHRWHLFSTGSSSEGGTSSSTSPVATSTGTTGLGGVSTRTTSLGGEDDA